MFVVLVTSQVIEEEQEVHTAVEAVMPLVVEPLQGEMALPALSALFGPAQHVNSRQLA
jgi:hypothetical protein